MNRIHSRLVCMAATAPTALMLAGQILALDEGPAIANKNGIDEIVVTARKRDETSISVPVVISAITKSELEQKSISTMDDVARFVPGLIIGEGGGTLQGGEVSLRGLGGADTNPQGDQAVAFDMDGVAVARATLRRLSEMDMQQVEVLKGPQALFFGKNSPGGVISIRTADPTNHYEAKFSEAYEQIAQEYKTEGYISGPLTDTLGARLAFFRDDMRGWSTDAVPLSSPFAPSNTHVPNDRESAARATLTWNPNEGFHARLKFAASSLDGSGSYANQQYIGCPFGEPQPLISGMVANCRPSNQNIVGNVGGALAYPSALLGPLYNGGIPYDHETQILSGLELNYDLTEKLRITSVTGYYQSRMRNFDNFTNGYYAPTLGAAFFLLNIGETSEELRINTDFDGPVNFTAGAYLQSVAGEDSIRTAFNAVKPAASTQADFHQNGTTYSGFGQARWQVISSVELAAGARYSHEHKEIPTADIGTGFAPLTPRIITPSNQASWSDTSPEATLTWRPSRIFTVFAAYKTGFLSGGFNTGSSSYQNIQYQPETIKGVEGGVKALLLDGGLRTNLSLYHYKLDGLQVTVPVGPLNSIEELNAGGANINGVEFDANYLTPIHGLKLTAAAAYNEANYTHYIASCYSSEPAPQCRILFNPITGLSSLSQNLAGTQLVRAPLWTGNVGVDYEQPVTIWQRSNLKVGLSSDMTFTSSYFTSADNRPAGIEPAYRLLDATLRLAESDDRWEIALIGRNLTNKYYFDRSLGVTFTGGAAGTAAPAPSDVAAVVSRGREMMVRGTWKFN